MGVGESGAWASRARFNDRLYLPLSLMARHRLFDRLDFDDPLDLADAHGRPLGPLPSNVVLAVDPAKARSGRAGPGEHARGSAGVARLAMMSA
jgi:hypothetical protein